MSSVDQILAYMQARQPEIVSLIRQFVECESPSSDAAAVNRFVDLVAATLSPLASVRTVRTRQAGNILLCRMRFPGRRRTGQVLVLGHSDTVWPIGTLRTMPFRASGGRLWGPGVFDMKAGIAFFCFAARALRDLDIPVPSRVLLQLNPDEEVGSLSSRGLTEAHAARSKAVLVLEPAAGLDGKLKTARKGVGEFTVTVRGRAAHAGLDFSAGSSAIVELARQITRMAGFTDLARGITVNPGVISGGSRPNVIAAEAAAAVDFRVPRPRDAARIEKRFRSLCPLDPDCTVAVEGGLNRPPLERSAGVARLFRTARKLARELGMELGESSAGGASDGNFTAALGIPTLDGLGAIGEGAHAAHESILINRIADRTALIAKLLLAQLPEIRPAL